MIPVKKPRPNEADVEVDAILARAGVKVGARYCGEVIRRNGGKGWPCDQWLVSFNGETFDFFTGVGCRLDAPKVGHLTPNTLAWVSWKAQARPVCPTAAEVLFALLLDGRAAEMSFTDWCAEFGFDDDSISALETYRECEKNWRRLTKALASCALVAELRKAVADY